MQFEYDPEQLISEVSKRPALWNTEHPGYRAKHLKLQQWHDVVSELVNINDITMSKSEMRELELQLQKKWKSLRDCFKKYMANPNKFKRPYVYSRHLQFLLKDEKLPVERKVTVIPVGPVASTGENDFDDDDEPRQYQKNVWVPKKMIRIQKLKAQSSDDDNYYDPPPDDIDNTSEGNANESDTPGQFAFADVSQKSDTEDADKMFLMSLLPHLRSIPEEFKLNVKLELMQVLRVANNSTAKLKYNHSNLD